MRRLIAARSSFSMYTERARRMNSASKLRARSLSRMGQRQVKVSSHAGSPERMATVSVGFAPVLVYPPHVRRGEYDKKPLRLWVVCVREDNPPKGATPVEWILLTNAAVNIELCPPSE